MYHSWNDCSSNLLYSKELKAQDLALEEMINKTLRRGSLKLKTEKDICKYPPNGDTHLNELQVRKILHQAGYRTFSRPHQIPRACTINLSRKGGGMTYRKPGSTVRQNTLARVMPGNPNSPNPAQRKPYVVESPSPAGRETDSTRKGLVWE